LLIVTPDKFVDNIAGTVNFDMMTRVNFSNRLAKSQTFKKHESPIPFVGVYEDIKPLKKFIKKLNTDEVKCMEKTQRKEFSKSPSL